MNLKSIAGVAAGVTVDNKKDRPEVLNLVGLESWLRKQSFAPHGVWTCQFLERAIFGMATQGESMRRKWTDSGAWQRKLNSPKP